MMHLCIGQIYISSSPREKLVFCLFPNIINCAEPSETFFNCFLFIAIFLCTNCLFSFVSHAEQAERQRS